MKLKSINFDPESKYFTSMIMLCCSLLLFVGCASTSIPMHDSMESYTVTMERTACRGNCPVYALTIHGDGTVEFEGFSNVPYKGKRIGQLPDDSVRVLLRSIEDLDINSLKHEYVHQATTDMPSVLFTVLHMKDGIIRGKKIVDYQGDASAPEGLRLLYNRFDFWYSHIQWQ